MKVYGFKDGEEGIMELGCDLESEQSYVGGLIDVVRVTPELDLVVNDEGLLLGMEPSVAWVEDGKVLGVYVGNCFVCRHRDGEFISIEEKDIETIKQLLKPIYGIIGNSILLKRN